MPTSPIPRPTRCSRRRSNWQWSGSGTPVSATGQGRLQRDIVNRVAPVLSRGEVGAKTERWADLVAHMGWADYLRTRDGLGKLISVRNYCRTLRLLLAISPDGARWTGEAIVATLEEALELARLRGVTLERTNGIARILPALFEQSWSLQGEKALDFAGMIGSKLDLAAISPYVKE